MCLAGPTSLRVCEIDRYARPSNIGPAAVKKAGLSCSVDCSLFWNSCASELPAMPRLALRCILGTVNNADAERSFSLYNLVHSDRRSLEDKSLKQLLFLYFNRFMGGIFSTKYQMLTSINKHFCLLSIFVGAPLLALFICFRKSVVCK